MAYERQKDIFVYLLNSDIGLSGNELAKKFNVSSRTIRSDIKFLNELTKEYGVSICSSKQGGYFIPEEQKDIGILVVKKIFIKEENLNRVPNTPSERFAFIIFKLAFSKDYISMEELADMLYVSKTTIYLDVKEIISFLDYFSDLRLEISPIKGLKLEGDERSKRLLISNVLKNEKINDNLMLSRSFYYVFGDKNLNLDEEILFLYETIINVLNEYGYILTDSNISLLVKDILVSIKRIQMGFVIEEEVKEDLDLTIVEAFKKEIQNFFNISLNNKELEYFQQSFNAKRLLNVTSKNYVLKEEAEKIVYEFLKEVKAKFNIDFSDATNFKKNLILHINPMIERIKNNYFEDNPLKNQIKTNYSFAFEISTLMVAIIKKRLNVIISEGEVSYIALHVAVALNEVHDKTNIAIICGSGLGTAQLIRSKILSYYNRQVNIIGYFPIYKLENVLNGEYGEVDLIISTIPINTEKNVPAIQISPLINEDDLLKIRQYVDSPLITFKNHGIKEIEGDFFSRELFKYFDDEKDFFKAILELTEKLKGQGYIDDVETFYSSVLERENLYSTILENMIAIPHPMESMSETTVVAVGIFKNPIVHCGKRVKMILLFAVNIKEDKKMKVLYGMLQKIIESKVIVENMLQSKDFDEFMKSMKS